MNNKRKSKLNEIDEQNMLNIINNSSKTQSNIVNKGLKSEKSTVSTTSKTISKPIKQLKKQDSKNSIYDKLTNNFNTFLKENKDNIVLTGNKRHQGKKGDHYLKSKDMEASSMNDTNNSIPTTKSHKRQQSDLTPIPNLSSRNFLADSNLIGIKKAERTAVFIRRMEYSNYHKDKKEAEEDLLRKVIYIQRWYRFIKIRLFYSILLQSNIRGYLFRKRFYEKIVKLSTLINCLNKRINLNKSLLFSSLIKYNSNQVNYNNNNTFLESFHSSPINKDFLIELSKIDNKKNDLLSTISSNYIQKINELEPKIVILESRADVLLAMTKKIELRKYFNKWKEMQRNLLRLKVDNIESLIKKMTKKQKNLHNYFNLLRVNGMKVVMRELQLKIISKIHFKQIAQANLILIKKFHYWKKYNLNFNSNLKRFISILTSFHNCSYLKREFISKLREGNQLSKIEYADNFSIYSYEKQLTIDHYEHFFNNNTNVSITLNQYIRKIKFRHILTPLKEISIKINKHQKLKFLIRISFYKIACIKVENIRNIVNNWRLLIKLKSLSKKTSCEVHKQFVLNYLNLVKDID